MKSRFLELYNIVMEELDDENDVKNIEFLSDKTEKYIDSLKENETFKNVINDLDDNEIDSLNKRIGHSVMINFKNNELKKLKENLKKKVFTGSGKSDEIVNSIINILYESDSKIASTKIINYINSLISFDNPKKDLRKSIDTDIETKKIHSIKEYLDIPDILIKKIHDYRPQTVPVTRKR